MRAIMYSRQEDSVHIMVGASPHCSLKVVQSTVSSSEN